MTQKHTRVNMRDNLTPELSDRKTRDNWIKEGGLSIGAKADEKAKSILSSHKVEPLPQDVLDMMAQLIKRAEKELA
jgi:trimethylamine--corrinoid protein Co-methyltransferase